MSNFSYKSRFVLDLETNEVLEAELKPVLKKVTMDENSDLVYIYTYDIDDLSAHDILYLKAINLNRDLHLEVGKTYSFDPIEEQYEYDTTFYFVHRTFREAFNNVPDADLFYLVEPYEIFYVENGKYFCTSFKVIELVEVNSYNIFHKLKVPIDLMFKLSIRFVNLLNSFKNYLIKFNSEWNLDFLLEYTRYYNQKLIETLYNLAIEENKYPTYPGPLKYININPPDNVERRVEYIRNLLQQYTYTKINNSYYCYDFGDFIIDYFSEINIAPYFLKDYIIGDENTIIQYVKKFNDKTIKDHEINRYFINPYIWIKEIGTEKSEMLDRILDSPMNIDTFHYIYCYLKDIGPNQQLMNKILNSEYIPPFHLIKLLLQSSPYYDQIVDRIFQPISLRQHAKYMLDPNYQNFNQTVYDYQTIASVVSAFEPTTYPEYLDEVRIISPTHTIYYFYHVKETRFRDYLGTDTPPNYNYQKHRKDRPDSDFRYYNTKNRIISLPDIDDISIYNNSRSLFCKAGVIYYWVNRYQDDIADMYKVIINCQDYNTKFRPLYISSFQKQLRGTRVNELYNSLSDPVTLYYWAKLTKSHIDECYNKIVSRMNSIPTDELKYEIASFFSRDLDTWIDSIQNPYYKFKLIYSARKR